MVQLVLDDAPSNYLDNYQMEFIPMLWGRNAPEDFTWVKSFILSHPEIKYLLVMNEPDLTDQANRSPAVAASVVAYENVVEEIEATGRELALVGPAITWGTMTNYWDPVVWLDASMRPTKERTQEGIRVSITWLSTGTTTAWTRNWTGSRSMASAYG